MEKFKAEILEKSGVVIGSETPWAEAILQNAGVSHVTTIEYMPIVTEYRNLSAVTPLEAAKQFLNQTWYNQLI